MALRPILALLVRVLQQEHLENHLEHFMQVEVEAHLLVAEPTELVEQVVVELEVYIKALPIDVLLQLVVLILAVVVELVLMPPTITLALKAVPASVSSAGDINLIKRRLL